jgi:hypothetical protein
MDSGMAAIVGFLTYVRGPRRGAGRALTRSALRWRRAGGHGNIIPSILPERWALLRIIRRLDHRQIPVRRPRRYIRKAWPEAPTPSSPLAPREVVLCLRRP